jgi:hypothetical protein
MQPVETTTSSPNSTNAVLNEGAFNEVEYSFWMIWCRTFEGDERWHMGRFPINTDAETACDIVKSGLCGGVGGDAVEVLEAEWGYDNGTWTDYCEVGS